MKAFARRYARNYGAAFSFLADQGGVPTVVGVADFADEPGEKITLGGKGFAAAVQPVDDLRSVQ